MVSRTKIRRTKRASIVKKYLQRTYGLWIGAVLGAAIGHGMLLAYQSGLGGALWWSLTSIVLGGLFGVTTVQMMHHATAPESRKDKHGAVVFSSNVEHVAPIENPGTRVSAIKIEPGQDLLEVLRASHPQKISQGQAFQTNISLENLAKDIRLH